MGGKGRGLAFINTLIYNLDFSDVIPGIRIRTPVTFLIGTDEFDLFMERNKLHELIHSDLDYQEIRQRFMDADLSYGLEKKLRSLLKKMKSPMAIRSSSLPAP